ncbi:MAG: class I tRNA ligase family protein [Candidatus Hodgkinia cicadicola]
MKTLWIYTSLIYTNASPHIGHLYEITTANFLCECIKLKNRAKLVVGTDDHGAKIQVSSKTKHISAIKVSNLNCNKLLALCCKHKINTKDWISTSYPRHVSLVATKLKLLNKNKSLYSLSYCGWYSPQFDCYFGSDDIRFKSSLMYCVNNVPTEWIEEQSVFISFSKIGKKILSVHRAKLVLTPNLAHHNLLSSIGPIEDVCITRNRATNYGIRLAFKKFKPVLWVWIDAILAYAEGKRNKVHIIGKDVFKFHLFHYVALLLLLEAKLPKVILQHAHIVALRAKISKSLGNRPNKSDFQTETLRYYLCTRPFKTDIELSDSAVKAAFTRLVNNIGNLAKRVTKLLALNQLTTRRLTVSGWLLMCYAKQLAAAFEYLTNSFKLSEANEVVLNSAAKINAAITNYKPWRDKRANEVFVYSFATKCHIERLKPLLGNKANLMLLNIIQANTDYMPFVSLNTSC